MDLNTKIRKNFFENFGVLRYSSEIDLFGRLIIFFESKLGKNSIWAFV